MNYLHHALMDPDLNSLALLSTYDEARYEFRRHRHEAMTMAGSVAIYEQGMTYRFALGGMLRFAVMSEEYDVMPLLGCEWAKIFTDQLEHRGLAHLAVSRLFKPVYRGDQNGV